MKSEIKRERKLMDFEHFAYSSSLMWSNRALGEKKNIIMFGFITVLIHVKVVLIEAVGW